MKIKINPRTQSNENKRKTKKKKTNKEKNKGMIIRKSSQEYKNERKKNRKLRK